MSSIARLSGEEAYFHHPLLFFYEILILIPLNFCQIFFWKKTGVCVCACVCMYLLMCMKVKVKVTQLCPTLCDPMDCSFPGSSVHGDSPGKNTGMGSCSFLHRVFSTQGVKPGSPSLQVDPSCLSHQGSLCVCANIFECICVSCVWMFVSACVFVSGCICSICTHGMHVCFCVTEWGLKS